MTSTLMSAYMGQGTAAARPATPLIDTGTIGFYYATDTNVLSVYENGAWSNNIGGGIVHMAQATSSGANLTASNGNIFTPIVNISVSKVSAILTTVNSGVYKIGIAPFNRGTGQITGAPTYSSIFTEGVSGGASKVITMSLAMSLTASADYIVFVVRTDATPSTSMTFFFGGSIGTPAIFSQNLTANSAKLASLAPTTSDTWTNGGSNVYCVGLTYSL